MQTLGTIVWQNAALVAVDKMSGVLSVPGRQGSEDPRPVLGLWLQAQLGQRLWPVHRLDFEVSGLVVFALTADAHRRACQAFELRRVAKTYEALTGFSVPPAQGQTFVWSSLLVRGKRRSFEAPHGAQAETHARCEDVLTGSAAGDYAPLAPLCLWRLFPKTGRPHQLRVHLANHGYAIAGDVLYGGAAAPGSGIALRSTSLAFLDPADRQALDVPERLGAPSLWPAASTP